MKLLATSIWIVLSTTACSSAKPVAEPSPPGRPPAGAIATACTADTDCVVVETACCDHCNGGDVAAFNTASADAHRPKGCGETMCTQMACGAATASCDQGSCKVTIGAL